MRKESKKKTRQEERGREREREKERKRERKKKRERERERERVREVEPELGGLGMVIDLSLKRFSPAPMFLEGINWFGPEGLIYWGCRNGTYFYSRQTN